MKLLRTSIVILLIVFSFVTSVNASQISNNSISTPRDLPELDMTGLNTDIELIEIDPEVMVATPDWIVLAHDEAGKRDLIGDIERSDLPSGEKMELKSAIINLWNSYPVTSVDGGEKIIELTNQADGSNSVLQIPIGHVTRIQFDREKIRQIAQQKDTPQAMRLQTLTSGSSIVLSDAENQTITNLTSLRSKLHKIDPGSSLQYHLPADSPSGTEPGASFPAGNSRTSGFLISDLSYNSGFSSGFSDERGARYNGVQAWAGNPGKTPHGTGASNPDSIYKGHNALLYGACINRGFPLPYNAADVATEPDGWSQNVMESVILPLTPDQKTVFEAVIQSWDHYYNPDRDTGFAPYFTQYWVNQAQGNFTSNQLNSALYLGWASHFLTDVSNPEHTGFEYEQYSDALPRGYNTHTAYENYIYSKWEQYHAGQTSDNTYSKIVKNQENLNYRITNPDIAAKNLAKFSHAYLPTLYYRLANQPYVNDANPGFYNDETIGKITENCLRTSARYTGGLVEYTQSHTINEVPIADFTANPVFLQTGGTVQFLDKTKYSGPLTTHVDWDFGDGTPHFTADDPFPYSPENPYPHEYSTQGIYNVKLTVSNSNGATSKTMDIIVGDWPLADFTADPVVTEPPYTYHFTDKSTNNPTHWTWDFGDGTADTTKNPTHTFSTLRQYDVTLTASNTAGPNKVTKSIIPISAQPIAIFIISGAANGPAPLETSFKEDSVGWIDSRKWEFGDNSTSTEKEPTHTYLTPGRYVVKLTVVSSGAGTSINSSTIVVTPPSIPIANFITAPCSGYSPLTVQFTDATTGSPNMWNWTFGDGTWFNTTTVAEVSPAHTYTTCGIFNARLIACNSSGCNTSTPAVTLTVTPPRPLVKFSVNATSGYSPLPVKFTDTTNGSPTMWNWSFGDGSWFNTTKSTQKSPTHIYTTNGTFNARLIACNVAGCNITAPVKTITVSILTPPLVKFSANATSGYSPLPVKFTDSSTGSPVTWNWSFGDGSWFNTTKSTQKSPAHIYTTNGTFNSRLIACNAAGCNTTAPVKIITVNLLTPPVVKFATNRTSGIPPLTVFFSDQSTGVTKWNWSFGDGSWFNTTKSTQRSPTHIYTTNGTFNARLIACNAAGCNTTAPIKTIIVK